MTLPYLVTKETKTYDVTYIVRDKKTTQLSPQEALSKAVGLIRWICYSVTDFFPKPRGFSLLAACRVQHPSTAGQCSPVRKFFPRSDSSSPFAPPTLNRA